MVKRGYLFLLILIVSLPSLYASLELQEVTPLNYNFGDKINLNGFILNDNSFNGIFKINLICGEKNTPLVSRSISLVAGEKYNFNEKLTIPNVVDGDCHLKAFVENNEVIENSLSNSFLITKELNGNFVLANNQVQFGKDINVSGEIFKLNGNRINGVVNIYFRKEGNLLFLYTADIKNGKLFFNVPSKYHSEGKYTIDFEVRDNSGNEKLFKEAIKFDLTNLLNFEAKLNKYNLNSGNNFEINGVARDVYGNRVKKGTFTVKFLDKELKGNILYGDVYMNINVDQNTKRGFHNVVVEVLDESGNKGSKTLIINILSKADTLEINSDNDEYKPGEKIKIKALIYDQGRDIVQKDVKIQVKNPKNEIKFDNIIQNEFEFDLPLISLPGEWIIKAESGDLKNEKIFYIPEVRLVSYNMDGQNLIVTNIGNIKYEDNLDIKLDGIAESLVSSKKVDLDPGESINIDLGREVKTGLYKVNVNGKLLENAKIEGRETVKYKSNFIFIIIVLAVLGLLLFIKYKKIKFFKRNKKSVGNYLDEVKKAIKNAENNRTFVKKEFGDFKFKQHNSRDYIEIKPGKNDLDSFRKSSSYLKRRQQEDDNFKEGMSNMFGKN